MNTTHQTNIVFEIYHIRCIYICVCVCVCVCVHFILSVFSNDEILHILYKYLLATEVESDQKAPFSIATTLRCRGGHYSFP